MPIHVRHICTYTYIYNLCCTYYTHIYNTYTHTYIHKTDLRAPAITIEHRNPCIVATANISPVKQLIYMHGRSPYAPLRPPNIPVTALSPWPPSGTTLYYQFCGAFSTDSLKSFSVRVLYNCLFLCG